ncbi:MAG TPA: aminoglycoside adenylyltransferase domain-containing protein [Thermomicrobiales bacterium]|nr:aminoglycoside adenylyltransferase domain-containing protein [Thermomicrobiales bacterium]
MDPDSISELTPHRDINAILVELTSRIGEITGEVLTGCYLTGSLTYGGFERGSSDIDYLAIMRQPMPASVRAVLEAAHAVIAQRFPEWAERIEGSYITEAMLGSLDPPPEPRPYINGGMFWDPDPRYGNEWLINLYALRSCGVALIGPDPERVIPPIAIEDVREASRRDLLEEWVPKLEDRAFFASSHQQAYVTLTICRVLHRAENDEVVSKRVAARWVRERYPDPWIIDLVDRAERWEHGQRMGDPQAARNFILYARNCLGE